jgi:hypothetical protein
MNTVTKLQAILSLVPGAEVTLYDDEVQWINPSTAPVTEQQIATEKTRLQTIYDANEYARKRAPEYPPITDLADALYHQSKGDETKLTAYLVKCEAVKQKYPKE